MKFTPATRAEGLRIARQLKEHLLRKGYPLDDLRLFGSVASGKARKGSDIDIAILCEPFLQSKHEENVQFLLASKEIDLRIQTVCLHPEDLKNTYFGLAQEVKRHGISV